MRWQYSNRHLPQQRVGLAIPKRHRRRTPNKVDNTDKHEAKLRRDKCKIDDLRRSIHCPTNARVQVKLESRSREVKRTSPASRLAHTSRVKCIQHGWVFQRESRRTVLRPSTTPDKPLPSITDIDVKNQPTTTARQTKHWYQDEAGKTNEGPWAPDPTMSGDDGRSAFEVCRDR